MSTPANSSTDTIVVGVDTSLESIAALRWAAALASRTGAKLLAVHAEGLLEEGSFVPHVDVAAVVTETLSGTAPLPDLASLIEPGTPSDALIRVAQRIGANHIVVGHRGTGGTGSEIGSTALALVSRSSIAVTVVRDTDPGRISS